MSGKTVRNPKYCESELLNDCLVGWIIDRLIITVLEFTEFPNAFLNFVHKHIYIYMYMFGTLCKMVSSVFKRSCR
jgi:hypothetical protein